MQTDEAQKAELRDLDDKLSNAKEAAEGENVSAREKADAKLLEQEAIAQKLRAQRETAALSETDAKPGNVEATGQGSQGQLPRQRSGLFT
jgi:hypothetical protein